MKSQIGTITSGVFVFVMTLVINLSLEYIFASKGEYRLSILGPKSNDAVAALRVSNFSNQELVDVKFLVPASLKLSGIKTSSPIPMSLDKIGVSDPLYQVLSVALLPAKKSISFLVPMKNNDNCCEMLNAGLLGIEVIEEGEATDPVRSTVYSGVIFAVIYTIFYLAVVRYVRRKAQESQKEIVDELKPFKDLVDRYQVEIKQSKIEIEQKKEEMKEFSKFYGRFKAVSLKRLADHQRELSFWRDTIRKVLYQDGTQNRTTDKLFDVVTSTLGTYNTKKDASIDLEVVRGMSQLDKEDVDTLDLMSTNL